MNDEMSRTLDTSEDARQRLAKMLNEQPPRSREEAALMGMVMTGDETVLETEDLKRDYEDFRFMAPYVSMKEKATGQVYIFHFSHSPRFYFGRMTPVKNG